MYGPAETTIDCTFYQIDLQTTYTSIPIGQLLPGYQCVVHDGFAQAVCIGQEGELLIGGVGVFAGYLGREDLTSSALIELNGRVFYRTGDIVRLDSHGFLHYLGRRDHQIKLRGQRIELGEIERCLFEGSSHISACVVLKHDDDHLIAYVQSDDVSEKQLREHCGLHLPPFMIPSMFVVLKQLPLNANGKLDRSRLPVSLPIDHHHALIEPSTELETCVHSLWCELLQRTQVSTVDSIFSVGGHSLLLIQLYHRYKVTFCFDGHQVTIAQLFQHPTIVDHARLIAQSMSTGQSIEEVWHPLAITQGKTCAACRKPHSFFL